MHNNYAALRIICAVTWGITSFRLTAGPDLPRPPGLINHLKEPAGPKFPEGNEASVHQHQPFQAGIAGIFPRDAGGGWVNIARDEVAGDITIVA